MQIQVAVGVEYVEVYDGVEQLRAAMCHRTGCLARHSALCIHERQQLEGVVLLSAQLEGGDKGVVVASEPVGRLHCGSAVE